MVDVAQLVRVPDCDSGCCRFESGHPPLKKEALLNAVLLFFISAYTKEGGPEAAFSIFQSYPISGRRRAWSSSPHEPGSYRG